MVELTGINAKGGTLMRWRLLCASMLALQLAACATAYGPMGLTGGVEAQQIGADTYRIIARGNGYTDPETIQDYVLLKAAETTIAAGKAYFVVVSAGDTTRTEFGQTPGTIQTNVIGTTAFSTYNPGVAYSIVKPGQDAYIRILDSSQVPPQGAFSAEEIMTYVGSRVQRKK
jgi:hypothetical protein